MAGPGEVLVEVRAAPITPLDLLCASGTSYFGRPGHAVRAGRAGRRRDGRADRVVPDLGRDGARATGAWPRSRPPRTDALVDLPDGVDPVAFGALGLSAVAAHLALTWRGELAAGEQVIVLGAGGVVGQAAVQLARTAGARRVVAGARSPAARERAAKAGADAVVALDTDDVGELAARFAAAADGPVDLVLDPLFGPPAAAAATDAAGRRAAGQPGQLGGRDVPDRLVDAAQQVVAAAGLHEHRADPGNGARRRSRWSPREAVAGRLTVAHETVPLADATAAWRRQADGAAAGRIVLVP